ncbi:MAG: alpha/beta hydrolase [Clostridiales bacterium]|nr:alpha/beta hydrolase [Clostridiales bacterium]
MKTVEFGDPGRPVILLLHGGGLNWWNYREIAKLLESDYHVVLPTLSGHAGSTRDFTTMGDLAEEIIGLIDHKLGGSVALIGGVSLGAQAALEVLGRRPGICRAALIESPLIRPMAITAAMMGPALKLSFPLIQNRWFAKLQARSLKIPKELFEEYFRDTKAITKQNMAAFLTANLRYTPHKRLKDCTAQVLLCAGQKERRAMLRSAEDLQTRLPNSTLRLLPGLYHGEFSLTHPHEYTKAIKKLLQ